MNVAVNATAFSRAFLDGLRPDPRMTVSEWADKNRMLSNVSSAVAGKWRTSRTPYLRKIMDSLSVYDPVQRICFMAGAQIGKTEAGNNWIGYVIDYSPAPFLFIQPTVEIAQKVSKQRIAPMLEESPVLRQRVAPARSRDSGNSILVKEFRGGVLMMTGANSAAGLRSMPVRFIFGDEIDAWPSDLEGEGDPISLAEKRSTTFARRKIFLTSTPTIKDDSKIEREWEKSDKQRYFVACPHCHHLQWLRWRGFDGEENPDSERAKQYRLLWLNPEMRTAAGYLCENCGTIIEERYKTELLREDGYGGKAQWRATAEGDGVTRGFHLNSLYSPAGWKSWVEILREFEESSTDAAKLKTFVNTTLGEPFEEAYSAKINSDGLAKRAEPYEMLRVPMGGLVITAGVDVQDNRVEIVHRAWGVDEESWLVNHAVLFGDPATHDFWEQVHNVIDQTFIHASGAEMKAFAAAVDSGGHFTHEVYTFARKYRKRNILAIKGQSISGRPALGKPTKQDINIRKQTIKRGAELWPVGTDTIKSLIYGRLKNNAEKGAGIYHWPLGLSLDYWKQLTAERQIVKMHNGFPKRVWVKREGDRNEAFDCEVYAYAALQFVYTRFNRNTIWHQLTAKLGAKPADTEPEPEPSSVDAGNTAALMVESKGKSGINLSGWRRK